ncbi:MAG: HAD family hydrolase, partial [Gammaproteobacteria bacterium]|nr:HAD family hydrolase [Gammaproteobacteria bacterium]
ELAQTAKITHSGLGALIDVCLVSGTIGIRKPAPAIFTMMSKAVGIPLHECAMVGDSPELDIAGASRAGMRAIWMQGVVWPTDLPRNYDAAIRSITDVPDVVATL